jgi:hypothetical protein
MERKKLKLFKASRQISKRRIKTSIRKCKLSTRNWLSKRRPRHRRTA